MLIKITLYFGLFVHVISAMARITVKQGTLLGQKSKTDSGFEYYEFLQIPYAKPPVEELRLKLPIPPEPWEGVRDATSVDEDHICFQYQRLKQKIIGSEDCLYLNVYTPKLPSLEDKLLPVMVFLHGGGFVFGNGIIKEENGPDFLIENDVVLVFINYRLGVFGFLSLDLPEAAGNMGLKDQIMALKWIQENINKFGGDNNNVTVFGISAGAASVEYLMLSPLSKGLFHKAIIQSGSALNHWAINYDIKDLSIKLARELGYNESSNDNRSMYEFIFRQPFETLGKAALEVSNASHYKGVYFGFVPSIEKDFGNGTAFLTEYPYDLLKEGRFNKVPVIRGFNQHEGYLLVGEKPKDLREMVRTKRFFDYWGYTMKSNDMSYYEAQFNKTYLTDNKYDDEEQFAVDFFSDYDFASGIITSSKLMATNGVKLYVYEFSYDGNINLIKIFLNVNKKGAGHGDDTAYVIKMFNPKERRITEADNLTCKRFAEMWTNYAKTGNPTPSISKIVPLEWPTFNVSDWKYMEIDTNLTVRSDYKNKEMSIFEEIYEIYHK